MTDQKNKFIDILVAIEVRAQIAEAKADLALEMITRMETTPPEERVSDINNLFGDSLKKKIEGDPAAFIALKSITKFVGDNAENRKDLIHNNTIQLEQKKEELEGKIRKELINLLSCS